MGVSWRLEADALRRPAAPAAPAAVRERTSRLIDGWGWCFAALIVGAWVAALAAGFRIGLTVLALAGFLAAIAGLRWPVIGLFGVGILCTLDTVMEAYVLTGGLLRWNSFNYLLLVVIALHLPVLVALDAVQVRCFQLFALLLALEVVVSRDRVAGIQTLLDVAAFAGLIVYFLRVRTRRAAWRWLGILGGLAGALGGLVYFLQRDALPPMNANAWALFPLTALFTVCLAYPAAQAERRHRAALLGLGTVNVCWIFLSGSRGALLTSLPCLLFLLAVTRGVGRRTVLVAGGATVALVASSAFTDLQQHTLRRIELLVSGNAPLTARTSHRSELVLGGWRLFLAQPFGTGTGSFAAEWRALGRQRGISGWRRGAAMTAHAGWIKLLVENGIPGMVLFTAFLLSFTVTGLRRRRLVPAALGLLVPGVFALALVASEFQNKGLWMLAAGVAALYAAHGRRRRRRRPA